MSISGRLRYEILRRDEYRCRYCGATAADGAKLVVDHVTPEALGGPTEPRNLVTACSECNMGKSSAAPDEALVADVEADGYRWAVAMQLAAEEQERAETARRDYLAAFDECWRNWTYGDSDDIIERPRQWRDTIDTFRKQGLTSSDLDDFVNVAMTRDHVENDHKFRYFCGCCWTRIKRRQEMAAHYIHEWEQEK